MYERVIIVAGSPVDSFHLYLKQPGDFLIGVDKGTIVLLDNNYKVDVALGDFDGCSNIEYEKIQKNIVNIERYPTKKNEIDLELAFLYLIKNKISMSSIYVYNALGARIDHELIAFRLLKKYSKLPIFLISSCDKVSYYETRASVNTYKKIQIPENIRFSILPYPLATLEICNATYPLKNTSIGLFDVFTTSNHSLENTFVLLYDGAILLIEEI